MASSSSKKRKREAADTSGGVTFRLSDQPRSQIGPVLGKPFGDLTCKVMPGDTGGEETDCSDSS